MTQPELFQVRRERHGTFYESRLAQGQETIQASSTCPPMPAPANSLAERLPFGPGGVPLPPFARGSDTSEAAAIRIYGASKTKLDEAALSQWMEFRGTTGATDDEIQKHFNWDGDYERPRRWTLRKQGLIFKSEMKRKTKDGNPATVWVRAI